MQKIKHKYEHKSRNDSTSSDIIENEQATENNFLRIRRSKLEFLFNYEFVEQFVIFIPMCSSLLVILDLDNWDNLWAITSTSLFEFIIIVGDIMDCGGEDSVRLTNKYMIPCMQFCSRFEPIIYKSYGEIQRVMSSVNTQLSLKFAIRFLQIVSIFVFAYRSNEIVKITVLMITPPMILSLLMNFSASRNVSDVISSCLEPSNDVFRRVPPEYEMKIIRKDLVLYEKDEMATYIKFQSHLKVSSLLNVVLLISLMTMCNTQLDYLIISIKLTELASILFSVIEWLSIRNSKSSRSYAPVFTCLIPFFRNSNYLFRYMDLKHLKNVRKHISSVLRIFQVIKMMNWILCAVSIVIVGDKNKYIFPLLLHESYQIYEYETIIKFLRAINVFRTRIENNDIRTLVEIK